jgi:CRP-like cAMP-binding protein
MSHPLMKYLKGLPLFKRAPDEVLNFMATQTRERQLNKDDILIRQGDTSQSLFIIRTGWIKIITVGQHGEEIMLNQIGPGQIIGEMSLIDRQPRSNTVVAISPVTALEIDYDTVLAVLQQHPALTQAFLHEISERVRFANAYISEAIEWCQHIAEGNYDFVEAQMQQSQATIIGIAQSHQARANAFMSAFFNMAKSVRKREEQLQQQIQQLIIQVDEAKRQKAVKEITDSEFFENLQATAHKFRQRRDAQRNRPPDESDNAAS